MNLKSSPLRASDNAVLSDPVGVAEMWTRGLCQWCLNNMGADRQCCSFKEQQRLHLEYGAHKFVSQQTVVRAPFGSLVFSTLFSTFSCWLGLNTDKEK